MSKGKVHHRSTRRYILRRSRFCRRPHLASLGSPLQLRKAANRVVVGGLQLQCRKDAGPKCHATVGGVFGRTNGIAPGCEASLTKKVELSISNDMFLIRQVNLGTSTTPGRNLHTRQWNGRTLVRSRNAPPPTTRRSISSGVSWLASLISSGSSRLMSLIQGFGHYGSIGSRCQFLSALVSSSPP